MKILITGGHHTSSLPIISKLKTKDPGIELVFVGRKYTDTARICESLEFKDISNLKIKFYDLNTGKFYKSLNFRNILLIINGIFQSFYILITQKPNLILSFGGYIAVPVSFAAWVLGIPIFTHEQTVVTGYANKLISIFASKIFISWRASAKYFSPKKVIYSGLPLREEIFDSKMILDLNNQLPTIFVMGGKTGSHTINLLIKSNLPFLLSKYNVIHQTGNNADNNDFEKLKEEYKNFKHLPGRYICKEFIFNEEIGSCYSVSDFVICRSGAHTIYELLVLKKKAILIPIPWVSHNEQYENARILQDLGLAIILDENSLSKDAFINALMRIRELKPRIDLISNHEFPLNASSIIVDEITNYLSNK